MHTHIYIYMEGWMWIVFEDGELSVITQLWVPKFIRIMQETEAGVCSGSPLQVAHTLLPSG